MITLVLGRTRAAVRVGARVAAARHTVMAPRAVPARVALKDLSAIPVCGSVRPQASQRALSR
jgi:hypothetical protein